MLSSASFASFFRAYLQSNCSHVSPLALALCTRSRRILIVVVACPGWPNPRLKVPSSSPASGSRRSGDWQTDMFRRGYPVEMHIHEESPVTNSSYLPWARARGAFGGVPSYWDHGARGCTVKFIVKRVHFPCQITSPMPRYWNPWLAWLAMAVLLGPNLTLLAIAAKHRLVNITAKRGNACDWVNLVPSLAYWPRLRRFQVDVSIQQCVFLRFEYIAIVHSQLINTMIHRFHLGMNDILPHLTVSATSKASDHCRTIPHSVSWCKAQPRNCFPATNRSPCHHPPL